MVFFLHLIASGIILLAVVLIKLAFWGGFIASQLWKIIGVKTHWPLLTSTYQEVLRYRSVSTSVRQVMEDTMLDGN